MVSHPTPSCVGPGDSPLNAFRSALAGIRDVRLLTVHALAAAAIFIGLALRLHFSGFLDPFEDGYQNWWISSNLLATGQYWDRHSMMTQGNWLPLYHFFATAVLWIGGWHNFEAMKVANIILSTLTAVLVFQVGKRQGLSIGLAAVTFFALNFVDIVVSGWATAESLATFLVFLGYAAYFHFDRTKRGNRWIAAAALGFAVMTRYEAWLAVALMLLFGLIRLREERRQLLWVVAPGVTIAAAYAIYASQWGFLPAIVVNQTSTDLRYQVSVGTQPSPLTILARWWDGYFSFFPVVLLLGGTYAALRARDDVGSWIVFSLWAFILAYAALRFGNPSYRYVMISVPFLSLHAAAGVQRLVRRILSRPSVGTRSRDRLPAAVVAAVAVLGAGTMLPSAAAFWDSGFASSQYMVPLQRAGDFVSDLRLPEGKILLSESPIAAYYSGYPPDRILGSRWLPEDRAEALSFLKDRVAYIVYMGVPYYKLRALFPELQNGTSTPDFRLLYDAGGQEIGAHAVYVYGVLS